MQLSRLHLQARDAVTASSFHLDIHFKIIKMESPGYLVFSFLLVKKGMYTDTSATGEVLLLLLQIVKCGRVCFKGLYLLHLILESQKKPQQTYMKHPLAGLCSNHRKYFFFFSSVERTKCFQCEN